MKGKNREETVNLEWYTFSALVVSFIVLYNLTVNFEFSY